MPVFNSEDHIIPDYSTLYEKGLTRFVSADIFQVALHGRAASVIWVWEKTGNPESLFYGNILQRPDALSAIGKASLDLNRLAYEINAFNEKDSDTAILYSNIERVYSWDEIYLKIKNIVEEN